MKINTKLIRKQFYVITTIFCVTEQKYIPYAFNVLIQFHNIKEVLCK